MGIAIEPANKTITTYVRVALCDQCAERQELEDVNSLPVLSCPQG